MIIRLTITAESKAENVRFPYDLAAANQIATHAFTASIAAYHSGAKIAGRAARSAVSAGSIRIVSAAAILNPIERFTVFGIRRIHATSRCKVRIGILEPSAFILNASGQEIPFGIPLINRNVVQSGQRFFQAISRYEIADFLKPGRRSG